MVNHGALLILVSEIAFLLINHFGQNFRQFSVKMLGHFKQNFPLFVFKFSTIFTQNFLNRKFWPLFTLFFNGINFTGNRPEVNL